MEDIEFNLIDEPWIKVMDNNCHVSEVSLKDALLNAHNYTSLSGELPTQDVAVMRLMLAVLHTVYSRVDEDGNESPLEDDEDDSEYLSVYDAALIWMSNGKDEDYTFGYTEEELEDAL